MKFLFALIAAIALVHAASAVTGEWARADIFLLNPANGNLTNPSYATFTTVGDQVEVHIFISGIPASLRPDGEHGIHVHTYGDLSATSGSSLGPHWDPEGNDHGCVGDVHAAGDLGNFTAVGGVIDETRNYSLLALSGPNSIIGRGIVLHLNPDNCEVVSSAGARIAAGVIGVQRTVAPDVNAASPPTSWNTPNGAVTATCVLQPTLTYGEGAAGLFTWNQTNSGDPVTVNGWFSKNGTFGVHVHQWGDLSDRAAALNTGAHWDPATTGVHALPGNPTPHHAGDMGNTDPAQFDGARLHYEGVFAAQTLSTANSVIGRAFVVHTTFDDGTGTNGNAGFRQAQCVIGLAQTFVTTPVEAPTAPSVPVEIPQAQVPVPTPSSASSLAFSLALVALLAAFALLM